MHVTIGELARLTGTKAVTVRYYERIGLLREAVRTAAGYRMYSGADRDRLVFIRRSRSLGFSLDEIRELLTLADRRQASCEAVDDLVRDHLGQVRQRIDQLRALEAELERLSTCCQADVIADCRILEALAEPRQADTAHQTSCTKASHV